MSVSIRIAAFIGLFTLLSPGLQAQPASDQANRYAGAYKKYIHATCPIPADSIRHFVYFARDRKAIIQHPLLYRAAFSGAQIMYSWRELEPEKGRYDFSIIREDYDYLKKHGKLLFIQLQDASFSPAHNPVPDYLRVEEYGGGSVYQYNDQGKPEGWVAKRWNTQVRERFALLLQALGAEFDGRIAGINLQETAIGISSKTSPDFSEEGYADGVMKNMLAMKKAFGKSTIMVYANFMPGEWLPWNDKGYLRRIYRYGQENGIGLGGPDLMVTRPGQLNHTLAMMHEGRYTVPLGIAVQDGNYTGQTGSGGTPGPGRKNLVPMLHAFARDFLKVNYIFWVNQEPYFREDVLPCFPASR